MGNDSDWAKWKKKAEVRWAEETNIMKNAQRRELAKRLKTLSSEPRPIKEWEYRALMMLLEYDAKTNKTKPETKKLIRRLSTWSIKQGRFSLPEEISDRDSELILVHLKIYKQVLGLDDRVIQNLIRIYGDDHVEKKDEHKDDKA